MTTTTSVKRVHNFGAGPAVLPVPVLERVQSELLDYAGTGMSVMEMSHRSAAFEAIIQKAEADLRSLLGRRCNSRWCRRTSARPAPRRTTC
jgi:phosphoserine aminotransferase